MNKFIKIVSFLLVLLVFLIGLNNIFKFKYGDGIYGLEKFYDLEDNSIDLLVLGSSHAFEDINPAVLWEEQGIASYDLCGSVQPMWNTYYYLKEALKSQTPKLIILEGYMLSYEDDYSDDSRIIKNNYGLGWSLDKVNSLKVSCPNDRFNDFVFEVGQYHNRYKSITKEDFLPNQGNPFFEDWKGNGNNRQIYVCEEPQVSQIGDSLALNPKTEEYYRKVLQLAEDNNIAIMVVISPYPGITETAQKKYNMGMQIAEEYNVPFYNFNNMYDDLMIDFAMDFADEDHLNNYGNYKYTKFLSNMLAENYGDYIVDRRNDENYVSWDRMLQFYHREETNYDIKLNYNEISDYMEIFNDPNYLCVIMINNTDDTYSKQIEKLGDNNTFYIYDKGGLIFDSKNNGEKFIYSISRYNDISVDLTQNGDGILFNGVQYKKVDAGINIFVYDYITDTVVTAIGFDATHELATVK